LLANVAIRNAIQSRQESAIAATGATSAQTELIKRADEAYAAAERAGNAGRVQATKLNAKLTAVCEVLAAKD
jgi:hypothetical protein